MTKKRHKMVEHQGKLVDVFGNAKTDLDSLREEMSTYHDNLPEGLQSSTQGEMAEAAEEALGEAYDAIEHFDFDDPRGRQIEITYLQTTPYGKKGAPRWMQAATIQHQLTAIKETLDESGEGMPDEIEVSEVVECLDQAIAALDVIEFPGMYGR